MSGSAQPTDYFSLARRPGGTGSGLVSLSSPLTSPLPALATPGTPGTPGSLRKKGPSDFIFHETLGDGAYSTVVRATDRETGNEFAAKILDKRHIIKNRKVKFVTVEKAALNLLGGHPFIVKLYYTFQDETSLYFILDLARNGDLVGFLKRLGTFHEDVARWYCAEIVEALEYMHGKGVIHRDIKPENILLDATMHVKVTDFGTAKMPTSSADAPGIEQTPRSNSFVGTAEYVPPELLNERSAVPESDLWSLGCVIYQLLVGRPPFKAGNEYQTFQKILKLDYVVPAGISAAAADLIQRLLVENPEDRIGAGGNWTAIKSHPFFFGIPWGQLELSIPPELRSGLPLLSPPTPGGVVPPAPPVVIADEPDAAAIWPGPTGPVITASEPNLPSQLLPPTELFPRSASLDSLNGEAAESRISGSAARPVPPRTMASRPLTLPNGPVPNSLGPAVFATRPTTMVMSTQATEWNLGSRKLHTDILAAQRDPASPLYLFTLSLDPNEVILKYSPSIRRKAFLGLFSPPPRPLVLTSRPRLLAYRPDDYRKVKEQLDLRVDGTWCEILDARRFAIHSHRGGWTLEDSEGGAQAWVDALRRAMVAS